MRAISLVLCVLLSLAGAAAPAAAAERLSVSVVQGGDARDGGVSCSGTAPRDPGCVREMTLTGNFNINFSLSFTYRGYFVIRGFTETGATTIVCDWVTMPGRQCPYWYEGVYFEGQVWTMVVVAAGSGYWAVNVS